jgi:hypothetical protein
MGSEVGNIMGLAQNYCLWSALSHNICISSSSHEALLCVEPIMDLIRFVELARTTHQGLFLFRNFTIYRTQKVRPFEIFGQRAPAFPFE